jgi:hypothetical protein
MINTVNTKAEQLRSGYFKAGNGKETVLVMGSCRSVPYVNYLLASDRFTVCFIDPFNWNYDLQDNRTDFEKVIEALETHEGLISMIKSVDIFIHEYYNNFGMFNCTKEGKNIYQFGMNPKVDICIPNFNDLFILVGDLVTFDSDVRKMVMQDFNVLGKLSSESEDFIRIKSNDAVRRFKETCLKSDLPEMEQYFEDNYRTTRLFWTYNHVSKAFTLKIFELISAKIRMQPADPNHLDMFANNYTHLTEYDSSILGIKWDEKIKSLKDKIFG